MSRQLLQKGVMATDVLGPIQNRIAELERELNALRQAEAAITGGNGSARVVRSGNGKGTAKRATRKASGSPKDRAEAILEFVKKNPGTGGGEIKKRWPVNGTISDFVKQHTGTKLTTKGVKKHMKYSAPA
jgi:hypothetical protein